MGVRIASEELRVHIENTAESRAFDSHGGKAFFDGFEGGEWGGAEVGVLF